MESVKERNRGSQSWGGTGNSYKSPNLRTDQTATLFFISQQTKKQLAPIFLLLHTL